MRHVEPPVYSAAKTNGRDLGMERVRRTGRGISSGKMGQSYVEPVLFYPPPRPSHAVFRLSCSLPKRPHFGEVSVLDLLPGGVARFHCHMGYHLQGEPQLTCLNASLPVWSSKLPTCRGESCR